MKWEIKQSKMLLLSVNAESQTVVKLQRELFP